MNLVTAIGVPFRVAWALIFGSLDLIWLAGIAVFSGKVDPYWRDSFVWRWGWTIDPIKYGPKLRVLHYHD